MAKKRSTAKRSTTKKRAGRKSVSKSRTKTTAKKITSLKKRARKGLRAARRPLESVRDAGEKTWEALKSTTAQVVEGVKGRFE